MGSCPDTDIDLHNNKKRNSCRGGNKEGGFGGAA